MIGKKLKHYEVEELIGKGGMGVVYRARDIRLGRPVALKVLKEEITSDADRKKRFLHEARSASAVTHPAIAQVYDVDEVDGTLFIALEFVEGATVRQLIKDRELDVLGAVEIAIQAADGMSQAHEKGIVHRDLKSDNIMVTRQGHAKILDFGLAKLLDTGQSSDAHPSMIETMAQTQVGTVMGTVAYMSPEQARGKTLDHRSDIFSIGVVLYEMVTGELPFKGDSPLDTMHAIAFEEVRPVTVIRRDVHPEVQRILSRCLRKRPEDRYQSTQKLVEDLKRLKSHLETGSQTTLTLRDRVEDALEWLRFSMPFGLPGIAAVIIFSVLLGYLLFSEAEVGSVIALLLIGVPVYRFIRNRKARMIQRFANKASKLPEIQAVTVRENLVTVIADRSSTNLFIRLNSYMDHVNKKLFYGGPVELLIRDDMNREELETLLREPGVRYVRQDVIAPPSADS
ncbi:MAG: serine/threonine protein kinase [Acidobacteriota bacterium]|nr:MAG: serine/threonine protein kinase [Acidobacteriota bacterium]